MRARSWFVLAAWMAISAVISASVPTHDWFNHRAGRYVLSMMAVWSGLTGLYVWLRERPSAAG